MTRKLVLLAVVPCLATAIAIAQADGNSSRSASSPDPQTMPSNAEEPHSTSVDDASLQQGVKQQLSVDPAFAGVQVTVHNGDVDLTGSVPSKGDRRKAEDAAKAVPGVKKVKEHLKVGGSGAAPSSAPSERNTAGSIYGNSKNGNTTKTQPAGNPGATSSPEGSTPPAVPPSNTPPPRM